MHTKTAIVAKVLFLLMGGQCSKASNFMFCGLCWRMYLRIDNNMWLPLYFVVLGHQHRALCMLDKYSTIKLPLQPQTFNSFSPLTRGHPGSRLSQVQILWDTIDTMWSSRHLISALVLTVRVDFAEWTNNDYLQV
jgi:hypothetical protein